MARDGAAGVAGAAVPVRRVRAARADRGTWAISSASRGRRGAGGGRWAPDVSILASHAACAARRGSTPRLLHPRSTCEPRGRSWRLRAAKIKASVTWAKLKRRKTAVARRAVRAGGWLETSKTSSIWGWAHSLQESCFSDGGFDMIWRRFEGMGRRPRHCVFRRTGLVWGCIEAIRLRDCAVVMPGSIGRVGD